MITQVVQRSPWKAHSENAKVVKFSALIFVFLSAFEFVCKIQKNTKKNWQSNSYVVVYRNLLSPAGVQLQPATFWLKAYRAEDVPQMDTSTFQGIKKILGANETNKELVDPYLGFYFAGKKVKTKVVTECNHPEWNQELKLGIKVIIN